MCDGERSPARKTPAASSDDPVDEGGIDRAHACGASLRDRACKIEPARSCRARAAGIRMDDVDVAVRARRVLRSRDQIGIIPRKRPWMHDIVVILPAQMSGAESIFPHPPQRTHT
jgi:hypothetical protein